MFWYSFYSEDRRRMAKRSGTTVTRGQRRFQLFSGGRSDAGGQKMDYYDYNLLAAVILLTCFGLVMLYSVSAYSSYVNFGQNDMYFFERQAGIAFAAFVFLLKNNREGMLLLYISEVNQASVLITTLPLYIPQLAQAL